MKGAWKTFIAAGVLLTGVTGCTQSGNPTATSASGNATQNQDQVQNQTQAQNQTQTQNRLQEADQTQGQNQTQDRDRTQAQNRTQDGDQTQAQNRTQDRDQIHKTLNVGATAKVAGLNITLNSVRTTTGTSVEVPQHGRFVIVNLTFTNTTRNSIPLSTVLEMHLLDAQSYSYPITIDTRTKGSVDGELGAGQTKRGEVAFDVPVSNRYQFMFRDAFGAGDAIWEFAVK